MTRAPRKTSALVSQTERVAKRLVRQSKHLEKDLINEMQHKVLPTKGKMPKFSDIIQLNPLTDTQSNFFESYENNDATAYLLHGSAGTGKSFISMYFALLDLLETNSAYRRIIIIRSCVQSREIGHLPGSVDEKMEQFELPYIDICADLTNNKDAYEKLKDIGKIQFMSSSFLRGSTFNDSLVIVDEVQNFSFNELHTVMSRLGRNSKFLICGDSAQNDLVKSKYDITGFRDFMAVTKQMPEFRSFRFTSDDIVRSDFCKSWIVSKEKLGL